MNLKELGESMTTAMGEYVSEGLKPCPFCGKAESVELTTKAEIADLSEAEYEYWEGDNQFLVICNASMDGCGASSGEFYTEEEAINAWNRRAEDEGN